jgi:hypothetical protein
MLTGGHFGVERLPHWQGGHAQVTPVAVSTPSSLSCWTAWAAGAPSAQAAVWRAGGSGVVSLELPAASAV